MSFDSTDLENAVVALLQPLRASHGVLTLKKYDGELDADRITATMGRVPAVLVLYAGGRNEDLGARQVFMARLVVFCLESGLREGTARPGVNALLRGVRDILAGCEIVRSSVASLEREEAVSAASGMSCFAATYKIPVYWMAGQGGIHG